MAGESTKLHAGRHNFGLPAGLIHSKRSSIGLGYGLFFKIQASTPASWRRSRQKPNAWAYPTRHYSIPLSSGTQKENLT